MNIDLDVVEGNVCNGNYLPEQLAPMLLALIGRIKSLTGALDLACERIEMTNRPADVPFVARMRDMLDRRLVQNGDGYAWVSPSPTWAVESHQKHVNGHHLILVNAATHAHADVTLLPNRATVIFAGPGRAPHIASLTAHADILRYMDTGAHRDPDLKVDASTYVLQIAGMGSWEVLRPVFGEVYVGAVL